MRLQRSISRQIGGKEYVKHQVVIPNNIITRVGWSPRDHIEARITAKGILLYKTEPIQPDNRLDYEQFKKAVVNALMTIPQGCSWSEIRIKASLEQKTPSPIWIKRMEAESGLQRIRDQATSRTVWKLPKEHLVPTAPSTLNRYVASRDEA